MPKGSILLADNDSLFAQVRAEVLHAEGYQVFIALNPAQAKEIAERGGIDLAILDLRLTNDNDEHDRSGLEVAKEIAPSIPKIMLTGFPSIESAREFLRFTPHGQSLGVDFVTKYAGPQVLLSAIEHILPESVNVELTLDCDFDSFSDEEKTRILRIIGDLLDWPDEIPVVVIEPGSTKLTITLPREQVEQLFWLCERGVLDEFNIKDAKIIGNAFADAIVRHKARSNAYDLMFKGL